MMNLFVYTFLLLMVYMSVLFVIALLLKDNSIVDIGYGLGFVLVAWSGYLVYGDGHLRQLLMLTLVTVWGLRLAGHIYIRKLSESGEDFRYRQWRESWGKTFVWRSYLQIFMLQGAVIYLVALPVMLVMNRAGGPLGVLDLLGLLIWLLGFSFEAVGDWQLLRFKQQPEHQGQIIQSGLWSLTRHPNYFGEATLWWGVLLLAISAPYGIIALISPLLIDFLLLKVSGIPMLEAKYKDNPVFEAYKLRTNAFFPWFPRPTGGDKP